MASGTFEPKGCPLAAADADGGEGALAAGFAELVEGGEHEAGTGGTDRVAEGDGSAAAVEFLGGDFHRRGIEPAAGGIPQGGEHGEHLGGEGLDDLDEIRVGGRAAAARRRHRTGWPRARRTSVH